MTTATINYQTGEVVEADSLRPPGIYPGLSDEEYFADPGASKSKMWRLHNRPDNLSSAEEVWAWINHEPPQTKYCLHFGRAFDDVMSYPENPGILREKYDVGPVNPKTGKSYGGDTKKFQEAQDESDKTLLMMEDVVRIPNMVDSIRHHVDAGPLIFGDGQWQVTLIWNDPTTGVRCKGRVDRITTWINPETRLRRVAHVDVKTSRTTDVDIFNSEAKRFGYFLQAAHYLDGSGVLKPQGKANRDFVFVVVNNEGMDFMPERHEVITCAYRVDMLESSVRLRDQILEEWASLLDGSWKPRRSVHVLSIPYALEAEHGNRNH